MVLVNISVIFDPYPNGEHTGFRKANIYVWGMPGSPEEVCNNKSG